MTGRPDLDAIERKWNHAELECEGTCWHDFSERGEVWEEFGPLVVCVRGLESRVQELTEALEAAADTFSDLRMALRAIGHPTLAAACQIAEDGSRAFLSGGDPQ